MRTLSTLALAGLFGGLLLVGDASACMKKKSCACPAPAPAPVVCKTPKVKHVKVKKTCKTTAPVYYCAPAPVMHATPQATSQTM